MSSHVMIASLYLAVGLAYCVVGLALPMIGPGQHSR